MVENLIEPLLSGIYAGDIYNLSLLAIFPHFYEIEQKHRSLILGMAKQAQKSKQKQQQEQHKGIFQTVSTGLQSIVEAIERQLDHTVVKKGIKVSEIKKEDDLYHLELSDGTVDKADAIVITAQHDAIPSMFPNEQQTLAYFKKCLQHLLQPLQWLIRKKLFSCPQMERGLLFRETAAIRLLLVHGPTKNGRILLRRAKRC